MARKAQVLDWNGKDLPRQLRKLPAGRYVVQKVDEPPKLSKEEDDGIEAALASYRKGHVVDAKRARALLDTALRR